MKTALKAFEQELDAIREAGTWREERIITTPQRSCIDTTQKSHVVNMCANNYLGLSNDPRLIEAAKASYDRWGFGLSSVRFICGTQEIHKELERRIAKFAGTDDAILYSSCFDANGGLFETLLGPEDAVISDELNHASIIDGVRLCKAKRYRYLNNNMEDLEAKLKNARESGCKKILIATDGVFSMDGYIANLKAICDLADRYDALTMVDDSHAVGFMGAHGRGTAEFCGVIGRVDIIRHVRQGHGRCVRRLYRSASADRRPAAAAFAPVPVLQHARARHLRRDAPHDRPAGGIHGAARQGS